MENYSRLDQDVHDLFHPDLDVPVHMFSGEVIFVDDFLGYEGDGYFVELLIVRWIVKVEVLDTHYKVFIVGG